MPAMSNPVPFHSEAFSLEVAHRLGQLMSERGTPAHQQVSLLTQLCGLSPSQARRKLQATRVSKAPRVRRWPSCIPKCVSWVYW